MRTQLSLRQVPLRLQLRCVSSFPPIYPVGKPRERILGTIRIRKGCCAEGVAWLSRESRGGLGVGRWALSIREDNRLAATCRESPAVTRRNGRSPSTGAPVRASAVLVSSKRQAGDGISVTSRNFRYEQLLLAGLRCLIPVFTCLAILRAFRGRLCKRCGGQHGQKCTQHCC